MGMASLGRESVHAPSSGGELGEHAGEQSFGVSLRQHRFDGNRSGFRSGFDFDFFHKPLIPFNKSPDSGLYLT